MNSRVGGVIVALVMLQAWGVMLTMTLLPFVQEPAPALGGVAWASLAGLIGVSGLACMFLALSRSAMGVVSPLVAVMGAAIPALVGIVSGDPVSLALASGFVAALVAIVLISLPEGADGRPVTSSIERTRPVDWLLILGAGLGASGFFIATDQAHEHGLGTVTTLVSVRLTSGALVGAAFVVIWLRSLRSSRRRPIRITRVALGLGALGAVFDTFGTIAYLEATALGTLSVTVVLSSFYPVSTALLARVILRERLSRLRLAGVGLAVVGAALIGLAAIGG